MTPIQKAIAEIESLIEKHEDVVSTPQGHSYIDGLRAGLSIMTANLEYERECIERAYEQGEIDCHDTECGSQAKYNNAIHYFTKTYGHDS